MEARRSGNYGESIWDDDYIQSLTTPYGAKEYVDQAEKLKKKMKIIIDGTTDELAQLELIDNLQRLDVSYHFEDKIEKLLDSICDQDHDKYTEKDLYVTALKFRLLRQNGYDVPQEVFCSFMDESGKNFKACLAEDVKGVLSLYEASFLSVEGESVLDSAKDFSTHHLRQRLVRITDHRSLLAEQVRHALELPLHWRVQKLEAKWFIHVYESRPDANHILLQLAKLDLNMVQAKYQDDIKRVSRRYRELGLAKKLSFARDRLAEAFLWAVAFTREAHFGDTREIMTMVAVMVTVIDDIYDVYGTLDELEVFTDIIQRWDLSEVDRLPKYMQICFLALFNFVNELGYRVLRDQGFNIISNLRNLWAELIKAYYVEARWFHSGYTPSTNEYLNNGLISISGPIVLLYGYFCITNPINMKELQSLEQYPGIIHWTSIAFRLADDMGTSSDEIKRGDNPKSIQCYMHETGCSEEEARKHIQHLIEESWKKMNKEILMEKPVKSFSRTAFNLARTALCLYHNGDGYGTNPYSETNKNLVSLIVEPIPMTSTN